MSNSQPFPDWVGRHCGLVGTNVLAKSEIFVNPDQTPPTHAYGRFMAVQLFDSQRFTQAQDLDGRFEAALRELRAGRKESHWMWFVFPQVELGTTPQSIFYSIHSLEEARAYLADTVLGDRLNQAILASLEHQELSAVELFGHDSQKFHASLTLFSLAADQIAHLSTEALQHFFNGEFHQETIEWLALNHS